MKFQEILNALEKNPELKFKHNKATDDWLTLKTPIYLTADDLLNIDWEIQDQVIRLNRPRLVFVNPKDSL